MNLSFTSWVFPGWRVKFEGVITTLATLEDNETGPFAGKMDPYIIMGICISKPLHKLKVSTNSLVELL